MSILRYLDTIPALKTIKLHVNTAMEDDEKMALVNAFSDFYEKEKNCPKRPLKIVLTGYSNGFSYWAFRGIRLAGEAATKFTELDTKMKEQEIEIVGVTTDGTNWFW